MTTAITPTVHPDLAAHARLYDKRVEQVTDRVFVAIGYGLANTIMIVGDGGVIIVDVMESVPAAAEARDALRAFSDLPVRALVYTHGHPDHVWGGRAWVPEGQEEGIEIYAHETVTHFVNEFANVLAPRYTYGAMHMYGSLLPESDEGFVVNGIGPRVQAAGERGYLAPTHTFAVEDAIEVAGVRLELVFAPGESPDQIFVHLPDDGVMLSGDTVYQSFPNIYTIRGARFRDPRDWYTSVDKIRSFGATHLVPCHGGPISGAAEVAETLTAYRDGIQYVFDQTVRGMNQGRSMDELATMVQLPPHLAAHPYLREIYGSVEFCVREIFAGLYGWYGGDSGALAPPPPAEESAEIVALAGGVDAAVAALADAVDGDRLRWAARLGSHILRVDPDHAAARTLQATTLRRLAYATANANARNWWLTEAGRLDGTIPITPELGAVVARMQSSGLVGGVPIEETVAALAVRLDPAAAGDVERTLVIRVADGPQVLTLALRRGVCAIERAVPDAPDVAVSLGRSALVSLVVGETTWADALASGAASVTTGSAEALLETVALFDGWSS